MLNVNAAEDMEVDEVEQSSFVVNKTCPLVDSDDKENKPFSFQTPKGKQVERGGGDLDVSEMNMKLRISCTPMSSPKIDYNLNQSGKYSYESGDDEFSLCVNEMDTTINMSVSEETFIAFKSVNNSVMDDPVDTQNETMVLFKDSKSEENKCSDSVIEHNESNESIGEQSSSPLLRSLKSVLNMFRPSQSPINPDDSVNKSLGPKDIGNSITHKEVLSETQDAEKSFEQNESYKLKQPIAFEDNIVKDLQWNEDSTIIFNLEKLEANKKLLLENKNESDQPEVSSIDISTTNKSDTFYSVLKGEETLLTEQNCNECYDNSNQIASMTNSDQESSKSGQNNIFQDLQESSETDTQEFVDCQEMSIKEVTSVSIGPQNVNQEINHLNPEQLDSTVTMEKCLHDDDQKDSPINITVEENLLQEHVENVISKKTSAAHIEDDPKIKEPSDDCKKYPAFNNDNLSQANPTVPESEYIASVLPTMQAFRSHAMQSSDNADAETIIVSIQQTDTPEPNEISKLNVKVIDPNSCDIAVFNNVQLPQGNSCKLTDDLPESQEGHLSEMPVDIKISLFPCAAPLNEPSPENSIDSPIKEVVEHIAEKSQSTLQKLDNLTQFNDTIDPFLSKSKLVQSKEADYFEPLPIIEQTLKLEPTHEENGLNKQCQLESDLLGQKCQQLYRNHCSANQPNTEVEDFLFSKPILEPKKNEYCLEKQSQVKIKECFLSKSKVEQSNSLENIPEAQLEDANENTNDLLTSKLKHDDPFLSRPKLAPSVDRDNIENQSEAKNNDSFLSEPVVTQLNDEQHKQYQSPNKEMKDFSHSQDNSQPIQCNDQSISEEEWQKPSELFLDNDLLDQFMNKKIDSNSDIGKQSLFLQFDPLCRQSMRGGEISELISTNLNIATVIEQKDENLEEVLKTKQDFIANPFNEQNCTEKIDDQATINNSFNSSVTTTSTSAEKPIMSVSPALSSTKTKSYKTPNRLPRSSTTYSSPAIAAVDQLISLSFNSPTPPSRKSTMTQLNEELLEKLQELKQLLKQKEDEKAELTEQYEDLVSQLVAKNEEVSSLEELKTCLTKENIELKSNLQQKNNIISTMTKLVEEHESTINTLTSQKEEEEKKFNLERDEEKKKYESSKKQLIYEKNELTSHLTAMEHSFNDLLAKYEKSKALITELKESEIKHREIRQEHELNYETLKKQVAKKISDANQELNQMKKNYETEIIKLKAINKRHELHLSSIESTLAQKNKENIELTAICDDLLAKVES